MDTNDFEVVEIGGGAAGLSAALVLAVPDGVWQWWTPERLATRPPLTCRASCHATACPRPSSWPHGEQR